MTHRNTHECNDPLPQDLTGAGRSRREQDGDESDSTLIYVEYDAKELLQILMETGASYRRGLQIGGRPFDRRAIGHGKGQ